MTAQRWVCQAGDDLLVDACGHTKSRLSRERKLGHASPRSKQLLFGNYSELGALEWRMNEWLDGWMQMAGGVAGVLHRGLKG